MSIGGMSARSVSPSSITGAEERLFNISKRTSVGSATPEVAGNAFAQALAELAALQQKLQALHEKEVELASSQHRSQQVKFGAPPLPEEDGTELLQPQPSAVQTELLLDKTDSNVTPKRTESKQSRGTGASGEAGHFRVSFDLISDTSPGGDVQDCVVLRRSSLNSAETERHVSNGANSPRPVLERRNEWTPDSQALQRRMSSLMDERAKKATSKKQSRMKQLKSINSIMLSENGNRDTWMLHPQSTICLVWDLLNLCFIIYEIFATPVQVFIVPTDRILEPMDWTATIFWTSDIGLTFMRATYINSEIEWNYRRVAKNYLKSWFFIDIIVVLPDWLSILGGVAFLDGLSFFRVMRLLKLMRLLRLVKMERVVRGVQQRFNQNYTLHFMSILRLVACIVILNHLLACAWYRLGCSFDDGWAKATLEFDPVFGYWTALHWSLTQFHGSMEVAPRNVEERVFAVGVVLLALIGFSQFLSSLTDMMIQLQRLRHDKTRQQDALRSYLTEHNISVQTSVSVKRYIEFQVDMQQKQAHQLEVLQILPRNLIMDLHDEARTPILVTHSLFQHFRHEYPRAVRMICHEAVAPLAVQNGETIFTAGDACSRMLFVDQGTLVYTLDSGRHKLTKGTRTIGAPSMNQWKIRKGEWICEVALWTVWENVGDLAARKGCMVLEVEAIKLAGVLRQFQQAFLDASIYAQDFLNELSTLKTMTDLDLHFEEFGETPSGTRGRRRSRDDGIVGTMMGRTASKQNPDHHGEGRRFSWGSVAGSLVGKTASKTSSGR